MMNAPFLSVNMAVSDNRIIIPQSGDLWSFSYQIANSFQTNCLTSGSMVEIATEVDKNKWEITIQQLNTVKPQPIQCHGHVKVRCAMVKTWHMAYPLVI